MTDEEKIILILQELEVLPKNYSDFELEYTKNHKEWTMLMTMAELKDEEHKEHIDELLSTMKHDSERIKELVRENNRLQGEIDEIKNKDTADEIIEVPKWILNKVKETIRLTNNLCVEKHYAGCYARMVRESQIMLDKILNNKEIVGNEYLQAMNDVNIREGK